MGIGHKQQNLFTTNWKYQFSHGGALRNKRLGRAIRPLSTKEPLHVVFKINRARLRTRSLRSSKNFSTIHQIIKRYAHRFGVKIEQLSVRGDHLHILVRAPRRSKFHDFFRVVAGQIAQRFHLEGMLRATSGAVLSGAAPSEPNLSEAVPISSDRTATDTPATTVKVATNGTSLWKYRPYSRVIRGYRAYRIVRDYIQLNEKEALKEIQYQKNRLRWLSEKDWAVLWR